MLELKFGVSIGEDGVCQIGVDEVSTTSTTRDYKGQSANRHVDDYCVLDLETTGVFVNSADIIEISALKVRKNEVVAEFSMLVNPRCHIPEEATAVNHITDEMVKDAPPLEDVIDAFLSFIGEDVVLGYNNAAFDMNLIYDSVQKLRCRPFSNDYLDMLHAVRRSLPELENAKLETVSKYYGLDTGGEHRALKDCYLTKICYDRLFEEFGDVAFKKRGYCDSSYQSSYKGRQHTAETVALQELHKLLEGMLSDGVLTTEEVNLLRYWVEKHRELSGNYPFDKAFDALDTVLEDGVITAQELNSLKTIFEEILDPVRAQKCHVRFESLQGKHICITGDFDYGARKTVEQLIVSVGGIIDSGVKKATNFVVVGAQGSEAWKTGNYGSKIQRAMELNDKGLDIKIIEEKEFIPAILELVEE